MKDRTINALRDAMDGRRLAMRLNRWFHRNSGLLGALAAFVVACLLGLVAAQVGMQGLSRN